MARKKKNPLTFLEVMRKLKCAGITSTNALDSEIGHQPEMESISERIEKMFRIINNAKDNPTHMIFFIMYDIEHNKVRNHIAKYLIKKGCYRVQKSVFLAKKERTVFKEIHETLKEVQDMYDNEDSILFIPVSTDELRSMKIVGKNINLELITGSKTTLFF